MVSQVKSHVITYDPQPCQKKTVFLLSWPLCQEEGAASPWCRVVKESNRRTEISMVTGLANSDTNVKNTFINELKNN